MTIAFNLKVLKYGDDLLSLFRLLLEKTFSKRGYSWSGKLLSSTLLTLTHTYPLENKFVNPEEWASDGERNQSRRDHDCQPDRPADFRNNHHRFWGKLYKPEDINVCLASMRVNIDVNEWAKDFLACSEPCGDRSGPPDIQGLS